MNERNSDQQAVVVEQLDLKKKPSDNLGASKKDDFAQLEQIVEDNAVESSFIPAYLSSTENDTLNNTELGTEYNTSRPLGGQTDRASQKRSANASRGRAVGGKTDRKGQMSEVQSSLSKSSYGISKSSRSKMKGSGSKGTES